MLPEEAGRYHVEYTGGIPCSQKRQGATTWSTQEAYHAPRRGRALPPGVHRRHTMLPEEAGRYHVEYTGGIPCSQKRQGATTWSTQEAYHAPRRGRALPRGVHRRHTMLPEEAGRYHLEYTGGIPCSQKRQGATTWSTQEAYHAPRRGRALPPGVHRKHTMLPEEAGRYHLEYTGGIPCSQKRQGATTWSTQEAYHAPRRGRALPPGVHRRHTMLPEEAGRYHLEYTGGIPCSQKRQGATTWSTQEAYHAPRRGSWDATRGRCTMYRQCIAPAIVECPQEIDGSHSTCTMYMMVRTVLASKLVPRLPPHFSSLCRSLGTRQVRHNVICNLITCSC